MSARSEYLTALLYQVLLPTECLSCVAHTLLCRPVARGPFLYYAICASGSKGQSRLRANVLLSRSGATAPFPSMVYAVKYTEAGGAGDGRFLL